MAASYPRLASLTVGLALFLAPAAAAAADYIVVGSTDPAIPRGQSFDAGAKVPLGAGRVLTLMHASGDVVRVNGATGGVVLPKRAGNQAEADRLAILKLMVTPAGKQTLATRTRGGICPDAQALTNLDAIVQVRSAGCGEVAREALETWLATHEAGEP
jgi:hypothetical protein